MSLNKKVVSKLIVLTAPIPFICMYIRKFGLTWLIMDSLVNLLIWAKMIMGVRVYFIIGLYPIINPFDNFEQDYQIKQQN